MSDARISLLQASMLVVTTLTSTGHLLFVRTVAFYAGRDGWIALLIATSAFAVMLLILAGLISRLPGKNLVEMSLAVFGPVAGRIVGLAFVWYFLHVAALLIRTFGEFLHLSMPQTPLSAVTLITLMLVVYASRKGIEVQGRANDLILPVLLAMGMTASVVLAKDRRHAELLPVLEYGWLPALQGAASLIGLFSESVVFGMVASAIRPGGRQIYRSLWTAAIIGVMFIGPITGSVALFGAENVRTMVYPTFEEMKRIQVAEFIGNLDVLGVVLWTAGSVIKAVLFLWAAATGLASLLGLRNHRPLIAPLGLITGGLAFILTGNRMELERFLTDTYPVYGITIGSLLPLLLLIGARLRRRPG